MAALICELNRIVETTCDKSSTHTWFNMMDNIFTSISVCEGHHDQLELSHTIKSPAWMYIKI